jgi:hypothetical protein
VKDRQRLIAILGMLGSEHAGERAAAALQADRLRKQLGVTWEQLLSDNAQPNQPVSMLCMTTLSPRRGSYTLYVRLYSDLSVLLQAYARNGDLLKVRLPTHQGHTLLTMLDSGAGKFEYKDVNNAITLHARWEIIKWRYGCSIELERQTTTGWFVSRRLVLRALRELTLPS